MLRLSRLQTLVLLAVAKYRFLTNSQLALMGLGKIDTLRRATRHLSLSPPKQPLLQVQKFPSYARTGRLEHVYSVSKRGKGVAGDLRFSEVVSKPVRPLYDADFFHRRAVITFQFLLDQALDKETTRDVRVETFDHYFHKSGANHRKMPGPALQARTRISFRKNGFFIPDSIFVLKSGNKRALFALECVFGNKKTRTFRQIKTHMRAMSEGVVTERYDIPTGQDYLALFLFHDPKLEERVRGELGLDRQWGFAPFREHFLFATVEEVKRDVLDCWRKADSAGATNDFVSGKSTNPIPK